MAGGGPWQGAAACRERRRTVVPGGDPSQAEAGCRSGRKAVAAGGGTPSSVVGPIFGNFCYPFLVQNSARRENEDSRFDSPFA